MKSETEKKVFILQHFPYFESLAQGKLDTLFNKINILVCFNKFSILQKEQRFMTKDLKLSIYILYTAENVVYIKVL